MSALLPALLLLLALPSSLCYEDDLDGVVEEGDDEEPHLKYELNFNLGAGGNIAEVDSLLAFIQLLLLLLLLISLQLLLLLSPIPS